MLLLSEPELARADFSTLQSCLHQKVSPLSNRNGIALAVVPMSGPPVIQLFGKARRDQIFEIGSITKTFTGLLLSQAIQEGLIRLDDPIPSVYQKKWNANSSTEITYRHLTTHTAGIISGSFPGYSSKNPLTPHADLTLDLFRDFYSRLPLQSEPGTEYSYSNIGTSLLGMILSEKLQTPYERLIESRIFSPLGMSDSSFEISPEKSSRFTPGYLGKDETPPWDLAGLAIAPAGGIRSTIDDMAKYVQSQLTESLPAIAESHRPLYTRSSGKSEMAMNWIIDSVRSNLWHNGATYGFNSILVLSKFSKLGVVALADTLALDWDSNGDPSINGDLELAVLDCFN